MDWRSVTSWTWAIAASGISRAEQDLIALARRESYAHAMREHGLEGEIRVVPWTGRADGQRAARALLAEGNLPNGLIVDDDIAAAAMSVFAQEGVRVPEDVSIIFGVDDSELARTPGST